MGMMPYHKPTVGGRREVGIGDRRPRRFAWWALLCMCCLATTASGQTADLESAPGQAGVDTAAAGEDQDFEAKVAELNQQILASPRDGSLYNNLGVLYAQHEEWQLARDAFIAAVQANPVEADYHLNLGNVFLILEQYDVAVREYEAYQKLDPLGAPDAPRLIGEAWRAAGDNDQARAAFTKGIEARGQDLGAEGLRLVLAVAQLHDQAGQSESARQVMHEHLPYAGQALAAADAGERTDEAEEAAILAGQLVNNLLAATLADAKLLEDSGLPNEAAKLYEEAYTIDPDRHDLVPHLVDVYIAADRLGKAKVTARRAREEHPNAPGSWIAYGTVAEKELQYKEAVDAFLHAKQLGYSGSDLDLKIGDLYMKLGETDKASRFLASGVADPEAPPEVVYNYAVSLIREKKYSEAVAPLQRVVTELPEMPQAWQALASALRVTKRYDEAVPAYEKALSFGDDPKLWFNLGFCQSRSNQEEAAVDSYRKALAADPTFKEAYYNLGRTLMSLQRYEEALAVMDDHLKVEPDSYRILFNQGFCLYELGRYEDSIQQYELALEQEETADVYNNIGLAYDKLGDKEMAQTYYREAKGLRGGSR